jgi:hypothetical protein
VQTITARKECLDASHRYFALEPFFDPNTSAVTIIKLCTNCPKMIRYDLNLSNRESATVIE